MKLYGIVGTGGFGREVLPVAVKMLADQMDDADSDCDVVFVDENTHNRSACNGHPLYDVAEFLAHPAPEKFFNIAIANTTVRKRVAEQLINAGIRPFRITAPNFLGLDNNQIDEGAIFCPFTMVTSNARIGRFFHANIYSYVAHDCQIGDYVTFAPGVHCNGNVIIEDHVYVGTGVVIREGTSEKPIIIGQGATLGMGAVITKSVPPFETVVGNPARPLRSKVLTDSAG